MRKSYLVGIEVPAQRVVDLFISACEGGSNYWCQEVNPKAKSGDPYETMLDGFTVLDGTDGKGHTITPKDIEEALALFARGGPDEKYGPEGWGVAHFSAWMDENDDATTADVFLQLCVFKKVIYG